MLKTLQIATMGEDKETVLAGIKNVPTHRLALICMDEHTKLVEEFAANLERNLQLDVEVHAVGGNIVEGVMERVTRISRQHSQEFDDVVLNVAGGDKALTCAAVSAAFLNGIKAFHLMNEVPVMLPVMKMSFSTIVSEAKTKIVRAIEQAGGETESLGHLSDVSGYGKPLLSYHIWGNEETRGLVELGLVEAERKTRGRLRIALTTLGKAFLLGHPGTK